MSEENVEIVRRFYEAQEDPNRILSFLDPGVVLTNTPNSPEAGTFTGYDGLRKWRAGIQEAVAEVRWEADDFIVASEDRVIVPGRATGHGRATKLPVAIPLTTVYTLRDGRITEIHAYDTRGEALAAAGLRE